MGSKSKELEQIANPTLNTMISQKILILSIVAILYPVDGRIFGKEWGLGRALKPNGLNAIVLNDCLARRSVYFHHKHSNSQGEQLARVLGEVSTSVTSRAIMDIITVANGHSPIRFVTASAWISQTLTVLP